MNFHWILTCSLATVVCAQSEELIGLSHSYCNTIPDFCDRVECHLPPEEKCRNGIVVFQSGGPCGCCDVCLQFRGHGENCTGDTQLPVRVPLGNTAQHIEFSTCQPGYACDKMQRTCTTYKKPNEEQKKSRRTDSDKCEGKNCYCPYLTYESKSNDWEAAPTCDSYGYFDSKRCKGRDNPRCFCVDALGNTIFGRIAQKDNVNATCHCSRAVHELESKFTRNDVPNVRCTQTGDYATLQCWNDLCFCVDLARLELVSNAVPIAGVTALPCYDGATYAASYYRTCEREKLKMGRLFRDFAKKGITTIATDVPDCDPDGTYTEIQWDIKRWVCSDRDGKQINNYLATTDEERQIMLCNCARDERYPDGLPASQPPDCDPYGNYNRETPKCFGDVCYCIDSDGQRDTDDFPNVKQKPKCT